MKLKKILNLVMVVTTLSVLTGCAETAIPLTYSDMIPKDGIQDNGEYNHELFYRNDTLFRHPDPFVLQVTDKESTEYGYYYLYGTNLVDRGYETYRSKDLKQWEPMSTETGHYCFVGKETDLLKNPYWAPEVIYDEETDKYYMFITGLMKTSDDGNFNFSAEDNMNIAVAVADEPYGPFETYDNNILLDQDKANAAVKTTDRGYWYSIDASPFYGADGERYMLFKRSQDVDEDNQVTQHSQWENVWGVRMIDWKTPDYSTLTRLTVVGYTTTEKTEELDYEANTVYNEGPHMYVRTREDGTVTYYLTSSINGGNRYTVVQAVSESPLGPYRKLTEEEGGILLGNDNDTWDHLKGTGHHCFVQAGEDLFIIYHQQEDRLTGGTWLRTLAMDRVGFVDNGKEQEVMHVNGPTWSLQPQTEISSEYKNIASEAKVSTTKGTNVEALTDGLLSIYKKKNFVKEFESNKTTTITLQFEDYREIKGLMIYNSKWFEKAFFSVDRIEFDFKNEEVPEGATAYINDLKFDWESYVNSNRIDMRPGGSAVAVFDPLMVKEIRITFKLPVERIDALQLLDDEGYIIDQETIGISEIAVLGK